MGISKLTAVSAPKACRVARSATGTHSIFGSGRTGGASASASMPGACEMGRRSRSISRARARRRVEASSESSHSQNDQRMVRGAK